MREKGKGLGSDFLLVSPKCLFPSHLRILALACLLVGMLFQLALPSNANLPFRSEALSNLMTR